MTRQFEKDAFFKAPVERVWRALTDPQEIAMWMGNPVEVIELWPGGRFKVQGLYGGMIKDVVAPHRLVWLWDPENGTSPIEETLTLTAEEGGTHLHLHSVGQGRWAENLLYYGGSEAGWLDWLENMQNWIHAGASAQSYDFGRLNAAMGADEVDGQQRVFFREITPGGVAEAAGIRPGDVLRAWNGRTIDRVSTFWRIFWRTPAGQTVRLELDRGGESIHTELTLAAPVQ